LLLILRIVLPDYSERNPEQSGYRIRLLKSLLLVG
jgi:hypothetical protein